MKWVTKGMHVNWKAAPASIQVSFPDNFLVPIYIQEVWELLA